MSFPSPGWVRAKDNRLLWGWVPKTLPCRQWHSKGLPSWVTHPPFGAKWGQKMISLRKTKKNHGNLRKNEESGTLAHHGLWGCIHIPACKTLTWIMVRVLNSPQCVTAKGCEGQVPPLTLVLPSLFLQHGLPRGGGYHPLIYELEIDRPKVWLFGTMV